MSVLDIAGYLARDYNLALHVCSVCNPLDFVRHHWILAFTINLGTFSVFCGFTQQTAQCTFITEGLRTLQYQERSIDGDGGDGFGCV